MEYIGWDDEFSVAVTVTDIKGDILYMNEKSAESFRKYGGKSLIGKNISGCHKSSSMEKIHEILGKEVPNVYTIEKEGKRKLIYQAPWYRKGVLCGLAELSVELPAIIDHFVRD